MLAVSDRSMQPACFHPALEEPPLLMRAAFIPAEFPVSLPLPTGPAREQLLIITVRTPTCKSLLPGRRHGAFNISQCPTQSQKNGQLARFATTRAILAIAEEPLSPFSALQSTILTGMFLSASSCVDSVVNFPQKPTALKLNQQTET